MMEVGLKKKIRSHLKKFLPFGFMRRYVDKRYDMRIKPHGKSFLGRLVWDLLPYGLVPNNIPRQNNVILKKKVLPKKKGSPKEKVVPKENVEPKEKVAPKEKVLQQTNATPCFEFFPAPWYIRLKLRAIERKRKTSVKDLYVVTGQLNSKTNEPIDSWTFFEWLQNNGIPSKYLIWREHYLYKQLVEQGRTKDVIALKGDGVADYEILRHKDVFVRARAFVQENGFLARPLQTWLRSLPGCRYVFLQHGILGIATIARKFFSRFNDINVASQREKELVDRDLSRIMRAPMSTCFVGGLPRYDKLKDESDRSKNGEFIVFVMFTWRDYLEREGFNLKESEYWKGLSQLISAEHQQRMSKRRIKFVVALHHHMTNSFGDINMGSHVEMLGSQNLSYWIRHAHACVTDFSSISFDFMFQNKPTIYWITDKNDPSLNKRDINGGGKVNLAVRLQKNFYNICNSCEEVLFRLEYYAKRHFELEPSKAKIAATYFKYRKDICKHVYEEIEARIAEEENNGQSNQEIRG